MHYKSALELPMRSLECSVLDSEGAPDSPESIACGVFEVGRDQAEAD